MTSLGNAVRMLVAGYLVALSGCREIARPDDFPPGMEPFTPPATYQSWWQTMETCSGRRGDFTRVNWFHIPDAWYFEYQGQLYDGYWWEYRHIILLPGRWVNDGVLVRHEMLHDLLNSGEHPPEYFETRCGGELRYPPIDTTSHAPQPTHR